MKVFISWSGARSHQIALALRAWLPLVLPHVQAWVSSEDIEKGARWGPALASELDSTRFGILCLVRENVGSAWVIFEAGAMSRSIDKNRVAPLLVDVATNDIPEPLRQFQCTLFEKEEVRKLMRSVNQSSDEPIGPGELDDAFDRHWPRLAELVEKARSRVGETAPPREAPRIVDKWVNMSYVEKAGIISKWKDQGYDVTWARAIDENEKVDLDGWEPVLLDEADGTKARLKAYDHPVVGGYIILLKRKRS